MTVWDKESDSTHELNDKIQDGLLLCVIRHVRYTARLRAYDVFRRCLSDVKLSHGGPRTQARMTRKQTPLHCG